MSPARHASPSWRRRFVSVALALAGLAAPLAGLAPFAPDALAAPTPPGSSGANREAAASDEAAKNKALAEKEYAKGYEDAQKAKKLAKEGKTAAATERFAEALPRFEEAVKLHERYADAWNMIGYCARQVGDLKRAFDAYDRALAIDPDHEEAHEYLGEAYVKAGNLEKAKEQLAWLLAKKSDEAEELAEAIEAAEKEAPAEEPAPAKEAAPAEEKAGSEKGATE